jgi:hypothetical protein
MGSQFFTLTKIKPNIENATPPTAFVGWMARKRTLKVSEKNLSGIP